MKKEAICIVSMSAGEHSGIGRVVLNVAREFEKKVIR